MSKITRLLSAAFVATTAIAVMTGGVAGAAPTPRLVSKSAVFHRVSNVDANLNGSVLTKRDPNPQYSGYYPEIDFTLNNLDGGIYKTAIDTTWSFTFMGVVSTVKAHYNICGFTTRDNGKTVGCRVTRVNLTGTLVDATVTDAYGKVHAVANF